MSWRTIGNALLVRLQTLLTTATPPGYVAAAAWVIGDLSVLAKLEQQAMTTGNAVYLARESSSPTKESITTLVGGSSRSAIRTRWRVRVLVRDLREMSAVLTTADTGLMALTDAVLACLDGFECSGIAINTRVKWVGDRPDEHKPGRYIATLLFDTLHFNDAADNAEAGETPLDIRADINLESGSDTEPNPVNQVKVIP